MKKYLKIFSKAVRRMKLKLYRNLHAYDINLYKVCVFYLDSFKRAVCQVCHWKPSIHHTAFNFDQIFKKNNKKTTLCPVTVLVDSQVSDRCPWATCFLLYFNTYFKALHQTLF